MVPCHVFAATADDYVSAQQGYECAMAWTGPCKFISALIWEFSTNKLLQVTIRLIKVDILVFEIRVLLHQYQVLYSKLVDYREVHLPGEISILFDKLCVH